MRKHLLREATSSRKSNAVLCQMSGGHPPNWGTFSRLNKLSMFRSVIVMIDLRALTLLPVAICGLSLSGCDRLGERVEITESREVSRHATPGRPNASNEVRFPQPQAPQAPPQPQTPPDELFTWGLPKGWIVVPSSSSMRMLDMRFGPNGEGQCYLTILPGGGGGTAANVNRWRTQMGQKELSPEEIEQLPKKRLFNGSAIFVDLQGDFSDVNQAPVQKDFRMLGLVHGDERFMIFVKLTGPKALVEKEAAAFDQFCQSLALKSPR